MLIIIRFSPPSIQGSGSPCRRNQASGSGFKPATAQCSAFQPHSQHHFQAPSSKLCQNWLRHRRGTLYLRAAVHRRCQPPPNGLGTNKTGSNTASFRVQELCECRGSRPGLHVLMSLMVSVDEKQHRTMLRHWSQFVPNMSTDIRGHEALHHHRVQTRQASTQGKNIKKRKKRKKEKKKKGVPS